MKSILVVDDMPEILNLSKIMLNSFGFHNVLFAKDGLDAINVLKNSDTECGYIISDYHMPKMNGLEFLSWIKKQIGYRHIPFLLMTGSPESSIVEQALKLGANDYVLKPFSIEQIKNKLMNSEPRLH